MPPIPLNVKYKIDPIKNIVNIVRVIYWLGVIFTYLKKCQQSRGGGDNFMSRLQPHPYFVFLPYPLHHKGSRAPFRKFGREIVFCLF